MNQENIDDVKGKINIAGSRGGDIFGNGARTNPVPFAGRAQTYSMLSNAVGGAVAAIVLAGVCAVLKVYPLIILSPGIVAFLAWYGRDYVKTFIFTLDKRCLFIRKGVFIHAYTLLPYENIQDIHVIQGMVDRLFGMWSVIIFTATTSGAGSEYIQWLQREDAEKIKQELFTRMRRAKDVTD